MKNEITPNIRTIKQSLYMGLLAFGSFLSPRLLGLSPKILLPVSSLISLGMFFDWLSSNSTHNAARGIIALDNVLRVPFRLFLQYKAGLLLLKMRNKSYLAHHYQWILATIFVDNFKSIIRYFGFITQGLPSLLDTLSLSDTNEKKDDIGSNALLKASISKIAMRAKLTHVGFTVQNTRVMNAYAHTPTHTITLNSGLIASIKKRKLIDAVIAHEISHFIRSNFDKSIYFSSILGHRVLYAIGFINLFYGKSSTTHRLLHSLGLVGVANIGYCGVLQGEEERADRKSCHLLDNPYQALVFQHKFSRNVQFTHRASFGNSLSDRILTDITTIFRFSDHYLVDFFRKMVGVGTHPSSQHRIKAIEDEIKKMELN